MSSHAILRSNDLTRPTLASAHGPRKNQMRCRRSSRLRRPRAVVANVRLAGEFSEEHFDERMIDRLAAVVRLQARLRSVGDLVAVMHQDVIPGLHLFWPRFIRLIPRLRRFAVRVEFNHHAAIAVAAVLDELATGEAMRR